jgi:hypothetical protein
LEPLTTGILYFESPEAARAYAETAIAFMIDCSGAASRPGEKVARFGDAMLFAEQRLLPMCMARRGLPIDTIGKRHPTEFVLAKNTLCSHLWGSKAGYRTCGEARRAYLEWLVAFIQREHPEAIGTLAGWRLDPGSLPERPTNLPDAPDLKGQDLCLIEDVRGVVSILDPNVDARRQAAPGMMLLPGDLVEVEPGASFRLRRTEAA